MTTALKTAGWRAIWDKGYDSDPMSDEMPSFSLWRFVAATMRSIFLLTVFWAERSYNSSRWTTLPFSNSMMRSGGAADDEEGGGEEETDDDDDDDPPTL